MTTVKVDGFNGFQRVLREVEKSFNDADFTEVMEQTADDWQGEHARFYLTETGPDGNPWQENAPATIAKKGHAKILIDKGDLHATLTDSSHPDAIREIASHFLAFGTARPYSMFNQEGTKRIPARPHVGATDEMVDDLCNSILDHLVDSMEI